MPRVSLFLWSLTLIVVGMRSASADVSETCYLGPDSIKMVVETESTASPLATVVWLMVGTDCTYGVGESPNGEPTLRISTQSLGTVVKTRVQFLAPSNWDFMEQPAGSEALCSIRYSQAQLSAASRAAEQASRTSGIPPEAARLLQDAADDLATIDGNRLHEDEWLPSLLDATLCSA